MRRIGVLVSLGMLVTLTACSFMVFRSKEAPLYFQSRGDVVKVAHPSTRGCCTDPARAKAVTNVKYNLDSWSSAQLCVVEDGDDPSAVTPDRYSVRAFRSEAESAGDVVEGLQLGGARRDHEAPNVSARSDECAEGGEPGEFTIMHEWSGAEQARAVTTSERRASALSFDGGVA